MTDSDRIAARLQEVINSLGHGRQDPEMLAGYARLVMTRGEKTTLKDINGVWRDVRQGQGWTYGPVKDSQAKVTPYLVPFEDLPTEVVKYDEPFREAVRQVAREFRDFPQRFTA